MSVGAATALFLTFVCAPAAQTDHLAGVIGLLALPPLAGRADCKPPVRREAPLHATPDSAEVIGWIRSDKDPDTDADCYRAVLNVYRRDGTVRELPTEEYEEEEPPAAVVVETRGRWFKLRLTDGAAWFEASNEDRYFSLDELLRRRSAYLTEAWDGTLAATAGGAGVRVPDHSRRRLSVRLVASRMVAGALWLQIEMMSHTIYESNEPPRVIAAGWVRAHGPAGAPVVWFYSRD